MFKAFVRVASRSVAIQLEEAAAAAKSRQTFVDGSNRVHQNVNKPQQVILEAKGFMREDSVKPKTTETQPELSVASKPLTARTVPERLAGTLASAPDNLTIESATLAPAAKQDISPTPEVPFQSGFKGTATELSPKVHSPPVDVTQPSVPPTAGRSQIDTTTPNPTLSGTTAIQDDVHPSEEIDDVEPEPATVTLRPSKVPSSRIGRLFHYGSLVAGLSVGAASEAVRRTAGGSSEGSVFMSEANVRRLVGKLSQMRGAALKLGQFMSIQDTNVLPEQLEKVLQQVQANADYMPDWQLEKVMRAELGSDWESNFSSFPRVPMAAASIGQVHRARLAGSDREVAVKVQFPGIHDSINSDLNNISLLLRTSAILPRGLYLNNTISVFRGELADECNYTLEADAQRKMKRFLQEAQDDFFEVPEVIDELSTERVLTTEIQPGRPLSQIKDFTQATRDKIGTAILRLCMRELFQFKLMQTDPNWANFLYDRQRNKMGLIDFGATRQYSTGFIDNWYRLLSSVVTDDRDLMRKYSLEVGYLTGEEHEDMVEAHLRSMELLAVPFTQDTYDFATQSVTDEVRKLIPIMLKHRLTPPPNETYSLNRKLSGSFLLCAKLGSKVECKKIWEEVVGNYKPTTGI